MKKKKTDHSEEIRELLNWDVKEIKGEVYF